MTPPPGSAVSRRRFLRQLLGAATFTAAGIDSLSAQSVDSPEAFRFAFVTDLHLLKDGDLRSAQGIAACLAAVEKLDPRPDFILVGGDLVDRGRDLTVTEAERRLDQFLKIWNGATALSARWVFGNHDLVATSNMETPPSTPFFGTGLFQTKLGLPQLYYGFDHKGWRFVVLDDIALGSDRLYRGELTAENLAFAQSELAAHAGTPTILCTHIPLLSNLPFGLSLLKSLRPEASLPVMVCDNAGVLTAGFPGHNVRAVLCGHLHHQENLLLDGIPFINSGAVCGNYWKGPMLGCPEGFGVVDVAASGGVTFDYRTYGWKAAG